MRRFTVSGLVPCDPVDLADHLLDDASATEIWPQVRDEPAAAARLRRTAPMEIRELTLDGYAVHRFLPASGGCLWTIESHARRRRGEAWAHFARRREQDRHRAMALVDTAAGYFASLL